MVAGNYIFIGGPLDLQSHVTQGTYYYDCIEQEEPIKVTEYAADIDPFASSLNAHRYTLTNVYIMGVERKFYISQKITTQLAETKIGLLIASLIDLYANS